MTKETLAKHVTYNKNTGQFHYLKNNRLIDNKNYLGYTRISINGKRYLAHRMAWIWVYGSIDEKSEIDHLNQKREDNRIINLRAGISRDNKRNRALQSNNTTGINGVSYDKKTQSYEVNVKIDGIKKFIGYYKDIETAGEVRMAINKVIGFSDIHGK